MEIDGESKMPSLFPFGKKELTADTRKRDDVTYLAAGNNVTPQRKPSSTIDLCGGKTEEVVIDSMVKRVRRCAFIESGVVQEVMDVDTGEVTICEKAERRRVVYRNINQFREMARDIVRNTLESRPASTSLEVIKVVDKFLGGE